MAQQALAFQAIETAGGLLTEEFFIRLSQPAQNNAQGGDSRIPYLTEEDYALLSGQHLRQVISEHWATLQGVWARWQESPSKDVIKHWLNPLFGILGYGISLTKLDPIAGEGVDKISHRAGRLLVHVARPEQALDKRESGESHSPHGLLQTTLNKTDDHLWGVVTNGSKLRLLRDHHSLTRQAYIEFDLAALFDQELYAEFTILWLTLHATRMDDPNRQSAPAREWILEKWFEFTKEQGVRALDNLQEGVRDALIALGSSIVSHPDNKDLRARLKLPSSDARHLSAQAFYQQLLRFIYRMIFVLVTEARDVLLLPQLEENDRGHAARFAARQTYQRYYALLPLVERSSKRVGRGGHHGDLFERIKKVMSQLREGFEPLALPALGSSLWDDARCGAIMNARCTNEAVLNAIHSMSSVEQGGTTHLTNWREVGADEIGPIYESLLEKHPKINDSVYLDGSPGSGAFSLEDAAGNQRKLTGAYYTPDSLVQVLLKEALDPVVEERRKHDNAEEALLDLKIVDPTCGSGHFLVAAAHRVAKALASVRCGLDEPSPHEIRQALADVTANCLYGVDMNPMAVELCKIALWLESVVPGRPLSFLDDHIQEGNALLGTWPALMEEGVLYDAFERYGDRVSADCTPVRKVHKKEARTIEEGQGLLFQQGSYDLAFVERYQEISGLRLKSELYQIQNLESAYTRIRTSDEYTSAKQLADLWCATFYWPLDGSLDTDTMVPTAAVWEEIRTAIVNGRREDLKDNHLEILRIAEEISESRGFFHWHLAFPVVFKRAVNPEIPDPMTGLVGGFDVVLGNPPWEKIKLQEKEFFAERHQGIATAGNASERKKLIVELEDEDPELFREYIAELRGASGDSHFVRKSGRFPLCGRGDVNTYALFAEHNREIISKHGQAGFIIPTGIATDDTTKQYFEDIMSRNQIVSLYDFENGKIFRDVDPRFKFCLLTISKCLEHDHESAFVFFATKSDEIYKDERRIKLTSNDISMINPNTRTCPIFRSRRDAEITKSVYRLMPILVQEEKDNQPASNPWDVQFSRVFDMSNDSHLFFTCEELKLKGAFLDGNVFHLKGKAYLPLYEGRMIDHFNHRLNSIGIKPGVINRNAYSIETSQSQLEDPNFQAIPRYWIDEIQPNVTFEGYNIVFRDVTSPTNWRTFIPCIVPKAGLGNKTPLISTTKNKALLLSILSSYVFDYICCQKIGGITLNYFIVYQLPVLTEEMLNASFLGGRRWFVRRTLELTYTNWELEAFAKDCGFEGSPFVWDEERRFLIRCELDAAFFHLYGIARDDVDYIMETFPIVKRKDVEEFGCYRTKETILDRYDEIQIAIDEGKAYQTVLDPPPGDPSCTHP